MKCFRSTNICLSLLLNAGLLIVSALISVKVHASVTLPSLISDNMVLQQNVPVHIWGRASVGEQVTVTLLNQKKMVPADESGKWELWLDPLKSDAVVSMTVSGINSITVNNILIGEVWFASGQSNMEWDVSQSNNSAAEIADANYPGIRIFDAARSFSDTVRTDIKGRWVICSSETIKNITAAGYFFARGLHKQLNVPIGLIDASWGATRCEAWTPQEVHAADPRLSFWSEKWSAYLRNYPSLRESYDTKLINWKKQAEEARALGKPEPKQPAEPQLLNKTKPSVIFNGVVAPISKYTIRGVIWYQGENNAYKQEAFAYRYLFPAMIQSWRNIWKQGDFPFLFAQLSTLRDHPYWPVLRESQAEALRLRNTGMAVTYDIGDSTDAHYKNKQVVGQRLELLARKLVYGEAVEASGPSLRQVTFEGNGVRVWFDHGHGLRASAGVSITGFEVAGEDGKLYPAEAVIKGESIVLSNTKVTKPRIVRYAFKDATVANLVNAAGLPAIPFRSDVKDGL